MGEIKFGTQSGSLPSRSTYSDMPIQVAERSVSRREFLEDLSGGAKGAGEILARLSELLNTSFCLSDEHYTFNSILNRGSVRLDFHILQQLQTEFSTMGSLTLQSARLMIDRKCRADVYCEGESIRLENLSGVFVVLVDGKRRMRGEIRHITFEYCSEKGLSTSIECTNPFSKMVTGSTVKLRLVSRAPSEQGVKKPLPSERNSAMKRFRSSYSNLESVSRTGAFKVKLTHSISRWFATLKEILGRKGS